MLNESITTALKNIDVDIVIVRNNKSEDGFSHGLGVVRKIDKNYKDLISA